jgi:S1-C subfamily serine protease
MLPSVHTWKEHLLVFPLIASARSCKCLGIMDCVFECSSIDSSCVFKLDARGELAAGRSVSHGYLGISLATCTPEWARQNNIKNNVDTVVRIPEVHGALVHKVFPRTPAERGGLRENDLVLEIAGKRIHSSDDARRLIDGAEVGTDLTLLVLRGEEQITLTVQPVDLATRLREIRRERQQQLLNERLRFQELVPFRLQ